MDLQTPGADQQEWDYYIESLVRYGRRPFTPDERAFLEAKLAKEGRAQRITVGLSIVGGIVTAMGLALASTLDQETRNSWQDVLAAILAITGLSGLVLGLWLAHSNRERCRMLEKELAFGQLDAYGSPPEWNQMQGLPPWVEVIRHSPITKRGLWIQERFFENQYFSPTQVAKAPPEYENLVESGWLAEDSELHRELSPDEAKELRRHFSVRRGQVAMAVFALVGLAALLAFNILGKRYSVGTIYLSFFLIPLVVTGWKAWKQSTLLRLDLSSNRLVIVRQKDDQGRPITLEVLEASGTLWSAQGAAAPWRGRAGAR